MQRLDCGKRIQYWINIFKLIQIKVYLYPSYIYLNVLPKSMCRMVTFFVNNVELLPFQQTKALRKCLENALETN